MLVVGNLEALSGFDAKHAGEMAGFVAAQFGSAIADGVYEKTSSGHGIYCSD